MGCGGSEEKKGESGVKVEEGATFMPPAMAVFYKEGLNGIPVPLEKVQANWDPEWSTHPNGGVPGSMTCGHEATVGLLAFMQQAIPDIKWTTHEVLHVPCSKGDKYVHIGTATGTPAMDGPWGTANGKSFHIMATDIHHVVDGKEYEAWHIEDWGAAKAQLADESNEAGSIPALHGGQEFFPYSGEDYDGRQTGPGKEIDPEDMPECLKIFYRKFLSDPANASEEDAIAGFHENWNSHPNLAAPGQPGPGTAVWQMISGFFGNVCPDLKWSSEMVFEVPCKKGAKYVHMGLATGIPVAAGPWGEPTGKGFKIMAIDVAHVVDGKCFETWHIEEFHDTAGQLASEAEEAVLHGGQGLFKDAEKDGGRIK